MSLLVHLILSGVSEHYVYQQNMPHTIYIDVYMCLFACVSAVLVYVCLGTYVCVLKALFQTQVKQFFDLLIWGMNCN